MVTLDYVVTRRFGHLQRIVRLLGSPVTARCAAGQRHRRLRSIGTVTYVKGILGVTAAPLVTAEYRDGGEGFQDVLTPSPVPTTLTYTVRDDDDDC